jgi:hypothetical protein
MRPPSRQQGIAVLLLVGVLVMAGTLFTLSALNASTWRADRYRVTQEALVAAKEALVARAVADDDRPGSLPCPDTDDDGNAELFVGNACPSYLGRLPWRTLHLSDLRDGSGERLWYALSATHRDDNSAQPINSNTMGEITITGMQPAGNALAVVFAPGGALMRSGAAAVQSRGNPSLVCTTTPHQLTPKCNPFNYLDVFGAEDNADRDTANNTSFATAAETLQFNDRALAVLADDVMPLVERRVGRELAKNLREHYDLWQAATGTGFYPWPAPFDPTANPAGLSGNAEGSLPMSAAPAVWTTASLGCGGVGTNQLTCIGLVWPGLINFLNFSGTVANVGTAFYTAPSPADVTLVGGLTLIGGATANWGINAGTQTLQFSYDAPALAIGLVTITVRAPTASGWVASSWITNNQWHRVSYYALSPHYAINGSQSCAASCITVTNVSPGTSKHAVVVTAGRDLASPSLRPVADAAKYLEAGNYKDPMDPSDYAFERALRGTAFNDQVTVVRP